MFSGDIHGMLMIAGFIILFSGFLTARFMKRKKWWLRVHKASGLFGALLTVLGSLVIVYSPLLSGSSNFTLLHAYTGLAIVILTVAMPALGFMQLTIKKSAGKIRPIHRFLGWIVLVAMFININLGIYMNLL